MSNANSQTDASECIQVLNPWQIGFVMEAVAKPSRIQKAADMALYYGLHYTATTQKHYYWNYIYRSFPPLQDSFWQALV